MPDLSPILTQEIKRIIVAKSPLRDRPWTEGGVSYVGGVLADGITHVIAFHIDGWGLHRWANFTYNVEVGGVEVRPSNIRYRPDLAPVHVKDFDYDDFDAMVPLLISIR